MDWDPRRDSMWALVYLGLGILHRASGGIVPLPSEDEFVRKVAEPVERETQERIIDPAEAVHGCLAGYLSRQRPIIEDGTRVGHDGEGYIYQRHTHERHGSGVLVTAKLMRDLDQELQRQGTGVSVSTLPDAARIVAKATGWNIPLADLLDDEGQARQYRFTPHGGPERPGTRAIFIPDRPPVAGKNVLPVATLLQPHDNRRENA